MPGAQRADIEEERVIAGSLHLTRPGEFKRRFRTSGLPLVQFGSSIESQSRRPPCLIAISTRQEMFATIPSKMCHCGGGRSYRFRIARVSRSCKCKLIFASVGVPPHCRRIVPIGHQAFCARLEAPCRRLARRATASLNAVSGYVAAMGTCSVPAAISAVASRRIPGILASYSWRPS
jgi:hypothetical protein